MYFLGTSDEKKKIERPKKMQVWKKSFGSPQAAILQMSCIKNNLFNNYLDRKTYQSNCIIELFVEEI